MVPENPRLDVGSHIVWYEGGAGAAIAGALMTPIGDGGLFTARDVEAHLRPPADNTPRRFYAGSLA